MQDPRAIHQRAGAIGAAAVLAFSGLLLAPPANADETTAETAAETTPAPAAAVPETQAPEGLSDQEGTGAAAELPPGLAEAVARDLGMSLEEFLAAGELGQRAALALPRLQAMEGFQRVHLEGGQIVITGSGDDLVAVAAELGAVVVAPLVSETTEPGAEETAPAETAPAEEAPAEEGAPAEDAAPTEQDEEAAEETAAPVAERTAGSLDEVAKAYISTFGTEQLHSIMVDGSGEFVIKIGGTADALQAAAAGSLIRMASAEPQTAAEFDAAYTNVTVKDLQAPLVALDDVPGGTGIAMPVSPTQGYLCSTGFNAWDAAGLPAVITAGHCTNDGALSEVVLENGGDPLGTYTFSQFGGPGHSDVDENDQAAIAQSTDVAVIGNIDEDITLPATVTQWSEDNAVTRVTGVTDPVVGAPVCKSGRSTQWTCGQIAELGFFFVDQRAVVGFASTAFGAEGDSGGSMISGSLAVGLVSAGAPGGGNVLGAGLTHALSLAGNVSVALFVDEPQLTNPGNGGVVLAGKPITGTVPNAAAGSKVVVTWENGEQAEAAVAADGAWTVNAPNLFTDPDSPEQIPFEFTAQTVSGINKSARAEFNLTLERAPLDAPAFGTPAKMAGPVETLTGTGIPGATIQVGATPAPAGAAALALEEGEVSLGEGTVGADGTWSVRLDTPLTYGNYQLLAMQENDDPNRTASNVAEGELAVVYAAPAITNLQDGQSFTQGSTPDTITGTGQRGATVTVTIGEENGTAPVDQDGRWSYEVDPWTAGSVTVQATQELDGIGSLETALTVEVIALAAAPAGNPDLADTGANGVGAAAAAGLLLVGGGTGALLLNRRRRGAHVASDS